MHTNTKLIFIVAFLTTNLSLLSANSFSQITQQASNNIRVSGSFNPSSALGGLSGINTGTIAGTLGNYVQNYALKVGAQTLGGVGSTIYQNTGLGQWWNQNSQWSAGMVNFCYEFDPTTPQTTLPDLCSIISNQTIDPCSILPNQIGAFKKKSSAERWRKDLPIQDWCRSFGDAFSTKNKTIEEAIESNTITDKEKEETKDAHFGSKKTKEERAAVEERAARLAQNTTPDSVKGTIGAINRELNNEGKGHISQDFIETLTKNTQNTEGSDFVKSTALPYKSLKEYNDATNYHAHSIYTIERNLAPLQHLEQAEAKFQSINVQHIVSRANPTPENYAQAEQEKITFIEGYIENEKGGYRNMAHEWAAQKAKEEIKYELPTQLEKTFYGFDQEAVQRGQGKSGTQGKNTTGKEAIERIYQVKQQQYYESIIMQKWRRIADKKADNLKIQLKKLAIASRPFNVQQAQQEIMTIIGAGQ